MVRLGEALASVEHPMREPDAAVGEALPDVPAGRPGEEDDEVGDVARHALERVHEHVRALDRLRLEPVAEPRPVLDERPDDECIGGQVERSPGRLAARGVDEREGVDLDPDRDAVHPARGDSDGEHELLDLPVGDVDALEAGGVAPERLVRTVELRVAGRPGPAVEVREPQTVAGARPPGVERGEVARVEDDLPRCAPPPTPAARAGNRRAARPR